MVMALLAALASDALRISNRVWRELIARLPPLRWGVNQVYDRRLRRHRYSLATLPPSQQKLLSEVASSGVVVASLDDLGLSGTDLLKESLSRITADLATRSPSGTSPVRPTQDEVVAELGPWHWGLQEDVLDLVERHLGLPARYYGADVRRECVGADQVGVRLFHRDIEDHRVFKILVWLDDVGTGDGPFQWVPREITESTTQALRYVAGFVTDSDMAKVVPPERWNTAEGPRWTVLTADTRSVFHRAGSPEDRDRYSVTFTWTSRHPAKTIPSKPFTPSQAAGIRHGLNDRQLACLPPPLLGLPTWRRRLVPAP